MKLFWNELKLKFKEQLRVTGKGDLNKADDYLVKRRKFKDVDITKDFEKRLSIKKFDDMKQAFENESRDLSKMSLSELEEFRENMKKKEDEDKGSDVYNKIVLTDLTKMTVLSLIKTHEFFDKFFDDTKLHPEMKKNLEIIEHNVKYNLPVEKRILFEAIPELFVKEIGQLSNDERKRFRRRRYDLSINDGGYITTGQQYQMAFVNETYEEDKIHEMRMYIYFQRCNLYDRYNIFFNQALDWGWENISEYIHSLRVKDKKAFTTIEKQLLDEILEIDLIEDEHLLLEQAVRFKEPNFELFPFPLDEKTKMEWISKLNHIKKFQAININDTCLVPYEIPEESFMDRLKKIPGVDIDEEIRLSNEKYLKTVNSGLPARGREMNTKDPELIRQINIVSQAVKVERPKQTKEVKYELPLDYIEEGLLGDTPTDGRLLIEEYYKVLYLNNEDPEKYNFSFWEQYFGVSKTTLRNIFNYIFFPLPDENNPNEIAKILYFQDVEFTKKRKIISEMTGAEYQEYLEKTQDRPELQELNRLDYLTYQTTAAEPRTSERTIPTDDIEIDRNIQHVLVYSDVIKDVDNKINELVKDQLENSTNLSLIERDLQIRLDEIKDKRRLIELEERKEIENASKPPHNIEEIKDTIKLNDEIKLVKNNVSNEPNKTEIVEEDKIQKNM